jgi:hypothetical protein
VTDRYCPPWFIVDCWIAVFALMRPPAIIYHNGDPQGVSKV